MSACRKITNGGCNPYIDIDNFAVTYITTTTSTSTVLIAIGSLWDKGYRYGQERDKEIGNDIYTAEFWEYDSRLGRRWNLDPVPQIFISDYSVMGGNPICFSDVLGDKWKNPIEDQEKADDLNGKLESRKNVLNKQADKFTKRADRLEAKGKMNRVGKLRTKAEEARSVALELGNAQKELDEIGKNQDKTFTFKASSGSVGGISTDDEGTIIINHVSDDNAIHELTHAYQAITGEM